MSRLESMRRRLTAQIDGLTGEEAPLPLSRLQCAVLNNHRAAVQNNFWHAGDLHPLERSVVHVVVLVLLAHCPRDLRVPDGNIRVHSGCDPPLSRAAKSLCRIGRRQRHELLWRDPSLHHPFREQIGQAHGDPRHAVRDLGVGHIETVQEFPRFIGAVGRVIRRDAFKRPMRYVMP